MFWSKCLVSEGVVDFVRQMMAHPEDWRQGQYCFGNTKHPDIQIWTANGVGYIDIGGNKCFNIAEKRYIADGIKKTIALRLLNKTVDKDEQPVISCA